MQNLPACTYGVGGNFPSVRGNFWFYRQILHLWELPPSLIVVEIFPRSGKVFTLTAYSTPNYNKTHVRWYYCPLHAFNCTTSIVCATRASQSHYRDKLCYFLLHDIITVGHKRFALLKLSNNLLYSLLDWNNSLIERLHLTFSTKWYRLSNEYYHLHFL